MKQVVGRAISSCLPPGSGGVAGRGEGGGGGGVEAALAAQGGGSGQAWVAVGVWG